MAIVGSVCSDSLGNIGSMSCANMNPFLDAVSLIFTSVGFEFATKTSFATLDDWQTGVRAKSIHPLHDIFEIEDESEESKYFESAGGLRIPRALGHYRHKYNFNKPFEVHKVLQSFRNANLRVFMVDAANNIYGYSPDGTKVQGFSVAMLNPEKMKFALQDNTPAWSPVVLDLKDAKEWNEKGVYVTPGWLASELEGISTVVLSVVSAVATKVVLKVAYADGLQSDGTANLVGIAGLVYGDFTFATTAPSPTGMIDNLDGTYDFAGVGMTSGSVDLKTPANFVTTALFIEASGPATITVAP